MASAPSEPGLGTPMNQPIQSYGAISDGSNQQDRLPSYQSDTNANATSQGWLMNVIIITNWGISL